MNKNKSAIALEPARHASTNHVLQHLAGDLHEVYGLLINLRTQLEGGGIIQVREIEPSVSRAVPKLRRAVAALNAVALLSERDQEYAGLAEVTTPSQSPLLI